MYRLRFDLEYFLLKGEKGLQGVIYNLKPVNVSRFYKSHGQLSLFVTIFSSLAFFFFCLHHCRGCLERVQLLKTLLVFTLRTWDFFLSPSFLSQAFGYNTILFFNKKLTLVYSISLSTISFSSLEFIFRFQQISSGLFLQMEFSNPL